MINPSFQQLLYSQSLDTWVISGVSEVDALVDEVYQQFLGHELKNNSGKTKSTLKTILLNLYSAFVSDPELYVMYSRDENLYSSHNRYVSQNISYQSMATKVIPGLLRLGLINDHIGFQDKKTGKSYWSRMRVREELTDLFHQFALKPWMLEVSHEKETMVLKDKKDPFSKRARRIPYKDNAFTREAREQLEHFNHYLEAAWLI